MVSNHDRPVSGTSETFSGSDAMVPVSGPNWPAENSSRPDILNVAPSPMDVINALRRRWGWALGLGILAAIIGGVSGALLIPENYTATAWLRVAEERPNIMFNDKGADSFLDNRRTMAALMTSNFVLSAALQKDNVAQQPSLRDEPDAITWLRREVRVSFPGGAEILQVAMTGDDRYELKTLVDAVMTAFMDEVVAVDREAHLRRKNVLELAYERNLEQIKKKDYRYRELADQVVSPDSEVARRKALNQLDSYSDLRRRVNGLRQSIRGMDRRIVLLTGRRDSLDEPEAAQRDEATMIAGLVNALAAQDPWIAQQTQRRSLLEMTLFNELLQAKQQGREQLSPAGRGLKDRLAKIDQGLDARRQLLAPTLTKHAETLMAQGVKVAPPTMTDRIDQVIEAVDVEKSVLQEELDEALTQFKAAAEESAKLGAYSAELESRKVELDRFRSITHRMGDELERREIELAAAPRVSVLEPATVPKTSDIKKKRQKIAMICLAAFGLAVCGVAAIDFLSRRVSSTAEVAYGLGVPVIGDLPMLSGRMGRHRSTLTGAASRPLHGVLIESIDNIRTALLHRAHTEALRTVMITSALEQEGKTTLSSQLAASLARSGRRTILLDGDLRRPSSHRLFELPVEPGMSELLRGEVEIEQIIRPTRVPGLWLGSAGTCDLEAIQALARGEFRDYFQRLRDEFDFIVIDSGPVLTDADALLFGQYADGVILSVLRDVSRVPRVFEAVQRLRAVDLKLLGAVVNGVSFGKYRSYYRPYTVQVESSVS